MTFLEMWNAVSEKATNDTDFSKYIIHYDYKAQQTGFVFYSLHFITPDWISLVRMSSYSEII